MSRKFTKKLIELVEDGTLEPEIVVRAVLNYMSEADVEDFALSEGFLEEDEVEDEDELSKFDRWMGEGDDDDDR